MKDELGAKERGQGTESPLFLQDQEGTSLTLQLDGSSLRVHDLGN